MVDAAPVRGARGPTAGAVVTAGRSMVLRISL
jgi:hypothetical protein